MKNLTIFSHIYLLFCLIIFIHTPGCIAFSADQKLSSIDTQIETIRSRLAKDPQNTIKTISQFKKTYSGQLSPLQLVNLLSAEAWAYMYTNNFSKAMESINKAEAVARQSKDKLHLWKVDNAKGMIFWQMELGQESLKYHLRSYEYFKHDLDNELRNRSENNIGYASVHLGFYNEALPYLNRGLKRALKIKNPRLIAIGYNNLGEAHYGLKNYDKAFELHQKALDIRLSENLKFHSSFSYHNLALIYQQRKQYKKAVNYLQKAISIRNDNNHIKGKLTSQVALARVYQDSSQPEKLNALLVRVVRNALKEKKYVILADAYELQRTLYQSNKQFEQALIASLNYQQAINSIQSRQTDAHLTSYLTQSDTVMKELNILDLEKTNEIQTVKFQAERQKTNITILASLIVIVILTIFLWVIYLKRRKIESINQQLSTTLADLKHTQNLLIKSEQMSALSTLVAGIAHQMNTPLGVSLTAMTHLKEEVNEITEMMAAGEIPEEKFMGFLASLYQECDLVIKTTNRASELVKQFKTISTKLEGEIKQNFEVIKFLIEQTDLIRKKCGLKKIKIDIHGSQVSIKNYPDALNKVLTQLMKNSIEHGFTDIIDPVIDIEVRNTKEHIDIIYQDNGKGIDKSKLSKVFNPFYKTNMGTENLGIGLSVAHNFVVQLMQGSITCEITEQGGTQFKITLPHKIEEIQI